MTHFTCKQSALDLALQQVNRALATRPTLPILANVLITAGDGQITLTATNLEIGISIEVEAEVPETGSFTLPAKLLQEFVHSLPDNTVEIQIPSDSRTAHIQSLRSKAHLKGLDASEFPSMPPCEEALPLQLPAALLKEMTDQVAFAAASDESRPVLTGVLLQLHGAQLSLVAADAFRLALRRAELERTPEQEHGTLLLPAKTMVELARILSDEGNVELLTPATRNQVLFRAPGLTLVSRLIEGTFPNFQAIVPEHYTTRAVLDRAEFLAAIKSAALFARDNSHITTLSVKAPTTDLGNGAVTVEATAEELGDGLSTLDASVEGPEIQMLFSSKYLADAASAITTPEIAIELTTPAKPGLLKPIGTEAVAQTYVVMPMFKQKR